MVNKLGKTLNDINTLYSLNLKNHGLDSKSVGWKDTSSQILRFDKLCQVMEPNSRNTFSVNDWGCGYGAMFKYLDDRFKRTISQYYGYDLSVDMINAAKNTIKSKKANFIRGKSVTHQADYTFVSGTFNVKFKVSDKEWNKFIENTLMHIASKSSKGFSFNLLSSYVDWKADNLYYADPLFYFDFCKRNISKYVTLIHDYPLYEWTICVKKV